MLFPSNIYAFTVQYLCFCIVISMLLQNESKVIAFCSFFPIVFLVLLSVCMMYVSVCQSVRYHCQCVSFLLFDYCNSVIFIH